MGLIRSQLRHLQLLFRCSAGAGSAEQIAKAADAAVRAPATGTTWGQVLDHLCSRRSLSTYFQPSRLYPQRSSTPESGVFWTIVGTNVLLCIATKQEDPGFKEVLQTQLRTSIAAVLDGHYSSILTGPLIHTSAFHCALNLLFLALVRRVQPLTATELLFLYYGGNVAGSIGHLAWYWHDAAGPRYGDTYARNTPGLFGCSGGVAAVAAYKVLLEPGAIQVVFGILPAPILLLTALYLMMEVAEPGYSDGPSARCGGAALGLLAALVATRTGARRAVWQKAVSAAAGKP